MADPEAVTRWTSQILAQIDSLPNLHRVGLGHTRVAAPEQNLSKSYVSQAAHSLRSLAF